MKNHRNIQPSPIKKSANMADFYLPLFLSKVEDNVKIPSLPARLEWDARYGN